MECCIVRKVPNRLPGTKRLVWAVILAEREGLALLFVQKPSKQHTHAIAIGTENVAERVFEEVNASRFPIEHNDLAEIGTKLQGLANGLTNEEFKRFFKPEELW